MFLLRRTNRKICSIAFVFALSSAISLVGVKPVLAQEQKVALAPLQLLAPDGTPVKNASVSISYSTDKSYGSAPGKTDEDGRLDFSQATPDEKWDLTMWVTGVGFANLKDFQFTAMPTAANSVRLQRGADFQVRCVKNTKPEKPLGNVGFVLQRLHVENGTVPIQEINGAESYYDRTRDGDGIGKFSAVPQGTYILKTGADEAFAPFAALVEVDGKLEKTVVLNRETTASVLLKVVDSDDKPVAGKTFFLRTNYAPRDEENQLFEKTRVSVAEVLQWNQDFRGWVHGYPLPIRTFVTDANGEATIYPMNKGHWKLALFPENSTSAEPISKELTVALASETTKSVVLQLKSNLN